MTQENHKIILTEQDIINTYNEKQREQCYLYNQYVKIKQENPNFGYKRIAKILGQPIGKTRWWNAKRHIPIPMQTINWLKYRGLLSLTYDSSKLQLVAKILGTTFGDGGIFGNLNGIFLSSSELEAVKEFGSDLKEIFGNEVEQNSRIIEGGVYGHSWCYQNTNRNIIRFFIAVGAPIGDKSQINLIIPQWVLESKEEIKDEFFGSLFGGEIGVPKVHINKTYLDSFSIGITGKDEFTENRINFLGEIAKHLNSKGVVTNKISVNDHKKFNRKGEPTKIYRLLISTEFENVTNFITLAKINYCKYKKEKLANTMNKFSEIKRQRLKDLAEMGYTKEASVNLLNLTQASLFIIENFEDFREALSQ